MSIFEPKPWRSIMILLCTYRDLLFNNSFLAELLVCFFLPFRQVSVFTNITDRTLVGLLLIIVAISYLKLTKSSQVKVLQIGNFFSRVFKFLLLGLSLISILRRLEELLSTCNSIRINRKEGFSVQLYLSNLYLQILLKGNILAT